MAKKLFTDRKAIKVYVGAVDHLHIRKKAGKEGVSAWVRRLLEEAMGWKK